MHEDSADGPLRRTRATPAGALAGRAARQFVAPLSEKLGPWQAEAIKLEVVAKRAAASGRPDPDMTEAVRALQAVVSKQAAQFECSLAELPEAVRDHSRVADVRTVLRMIEARLSGALQTLEGGGRGR